MSGVLEVYRKKASQAKLEGIPRKEKLSMEQRVELIRKWKKGENITALAEACDVPRKTV